MQALDCAARDSRPVVRFGTFGLGGVIRLVRNGVSEC